MASLDEIRAKLKQMEDRKSGTRTNEDGDLTFPHWNIAEGENATLRFLPDADPDNVFFWKERQLISLEFPGVKGGDNDRRTTIKVPCPEMFGDSCPVHAELRAWFKDDTLEATARKYWKKRSYLMQGFVIESNIREDNPPENPIRKFIFTPQIFNIIKAALMDPEMESAPTDYENGLNFIISKASKGGFNDYSTSKYSRRETALNEDQLAAIEKHGLFNLSNWLPARPDAEHINAIYEMWEASVNGELYDPERWGRFYRPWGVQIDNSVTGQPTKDVPDADDNDEDIKEAVAATAPKVEVKPAEQEAKPASSTGGNASDILAKIRARNQQA